MTTIVKSPIKTAVYIDGYNLYYGRLRGTAFKWLDLIKFFDDLLIQRNQSEKLVQVRFFTAPALAKFATHSDASVHAQSAYHRALKKLYGDRIEIINGTHSYDKSGALLPAFVPGQPYDRQNRTRVWKLEEKKTDVNLAISMYRDATKGLFERIILVSNDSDAEPALQAISEDFPNIMVGVVMPIHPPDPIKGAVRRASGSLEKFSHWTMPHLTDAVLQSALLPNVIPTNKKPILKPPHW